MKMKATRKDVIVGILFSAACLGMLVMMGTILASCEGFSDASYEEVKATVGDEKFSEASCGAFSDDYKEGFAVAASIFKAVGICSGVLGCEHIILEVLDDSNDNVVVDVLCKLIVKELAPQYNEDVEEYNELAEETNFISYAILGDDVTEDQLMEELPYYT